MTAFDELMAIRGLGAPTGPYPFSGQDPVLSTRFSLGETAAAVGAAIGVSANDLWEQRTGRRQDVSVKVARCGRAPRLLYRLGSDAATAGWAG